MNLDPLIIKHYLRTSMNPFGPLNGSQFFNQCSRTSLVAVLNVGNMAKRTCGPTVEKHCSWAFGVVIGYYRIDSRTKNLLTFVYLCIRWCTQCWSWSKILHLKTIFYLSLINCSLWIYSRQTSINKRVHKIVCDGNLF